MVQVQIFGDLKNLEAILSTVKKYSKKIYNCKSKTWVSNEKIPVEIGKAVEACGRFFVPWKEQSRKNTKHLLIMINKINERISFNFQTQLQMEISKIMIKQKRF